MSTVVIGMIGTGRACELHMSAYRKVYGINLRFKLIYNHHKEKAVDAANKYGFEGVASSFEEIVNDEEIDVIDICTPPYAHFEQIEAALLNNKNVICEKPLCGFFGDGSTDKKIMQSIVEEELERLEEVVKTSKGKFMYAENFVYAPSIIKAADIIKAKKSKILYAKGEESLAGSSSPVAGTWKNTGGGTLMRIGCHPLSAILWLKKQENPDITIEDVKSDFGYVTEGLSKYEHRHICSSPVDVEDIATVCITFSDGTKAIVMACDTRLGGSKNYVELYCNDVMLECNLTMTDIMSTYLLDEDGMNNVEISEMLPSKCGWNHPFVADEILRGYTNEMQDFMECVIENRQPIADFNLARETIRVIYTAYARL